MKFEFGQDVFEGKNIGYVATKSEFFESPFCRSQLTQFSVTEIETTYPASWHLSQLLYLYEENGLSRS